MCPITKQPHASPRKMVLIDYGLWAMAYIAFAGMAAFDYDLLRKVKAHGKVRMKREKENSEEDQSNSNSEEESIDVGTFQSKLTTLENERHLPSVEDIYSLLKAAFTSINKEDLVLLQSILMDILVLQPWTRNLDAQEEKALFKMEQIAKKSKEKVVDLTGEQEVESDDELGNIGKVNFCTLLPPASAASRKIPLNKVAAPKEKMTTPQDKEMNTNNTASGGESAKKTFGDADDLLTSVAKVATSTATKSPKIAQITLRESFGKEDDSDTEDDDDDEFLQAETTRGAQKALSAQRNFEDYDNDSEDFEGMSNMYIYELTY